MTDELQTTSEPNIVEQAKAERLELEKVRQQITQEREKIEHMRAEQILSGKTDAGQKQEEKKELTPKEYVKMIDEKVRNREI